MSFKAVWDIKIELFNFKNIAICEQCICAMVFQLYYKSGKEKILADPYLCKSTYSDDESDSDDSNTNSFYHCIVKQAKINKRRKYFQSTLFGIKSINTNIRLNEHGCFQIEINFKSNSDICQAFQKELYLTVDLFQVEFDFNDEIEDRFSKFDISQLKKVNTTEFLITDLYGCKFEYFSINFDDLNYCQCEGYITCNLVNYKFENIEQSKSNKNRHSPIIKRETDLNFAHYITKNKDWNYERQTLLRPLITPSDLSDRPAHNLTEFLFGNRMKCEIGDDSEFFKTKNSFQLSNKEDLNNFLVANENKSYQRYSFIYGYDAEGPKMHKTDCFDKVYVMKLIKSL